VKIYISDTEAAERMGMAGLLASAGRVEFRTGTTPAAAPDEMLASIGDAEIVCVALGRVTAKAMDSDPLLKLIIKCGIGVDNIDVEAATERGIPVLRAAGVNFRSVAEYVIGATIASLRRFNQMDGAVRNGKWQEMRAEWAGLLPALTERTIGIVGLGSIGRETARLAEAHGMRVIAHDPYLSPAVAEAMGVVLLSKAELLEQADVISLHVLLTDETRHLISDEEFALMKPGAVLVNSARGPIVDEAALVRALRTGRIAAAALDVLELEPPTEDNPLLQLEGCLLTPHLGGCTDYGYYEIGQLATELVHRFAEGRPIPRSCVVSGGEYLAVADSF